MKYDFKLQYGDLRNPHVYEVKGFKSILCKLFGWRTPAVTSKGVLGTTWFKLKEKDK